MSHTKCHVTFGLILIALVIGLVALANQSPSVAYAGAGLPPRATPVPPRPDGDKAKGVPAVGAYIELAAPDAPARAWVVVQWQDSAGGWHDVEGWGGFLSGSTRWWVHPKDFGTGPFRWVVSTEPDGPQLAASAAFNLPNHPNKTLRVEAAPNP